LEIIELDRDTARQTPLFQLDKRQDKWEFGDSFRFVGKQEVMSILSGLPVRTKPLVRRRESVV
jgi:hypothetical protein